MAPFGDDPPAVNHHDRICDRIHLVQNVARDDDMPSFPSQLGEESRKFGSAERVEAVERFVENQYLRIVSQRLSELEALLHSFRKSRNASVGGLRKA